MYYKKSSLFIDIYNWILSFFKPKTLNVTLNNVSKIKLFFTYYHYFPQFFSKEHSIQYGDIKNIETLCRLRFINANSIIHEHKFNNKIQIMPPENTQIKIKDNEFGIEGYFVFSNTQHSVFVKKKGDITENESYFYTPKIFISLNTNNVTILQSFINYVSKKATEALLKNVILNHYVFFIDKDDKYEFKDVPMFSCKYKNFSYDKMKKQYIDSFFHEKKTQLWKHASKVNFHLEEFKKIGQSGRHCILAYGPPGSGKSSYAYRLAMAFRRHVVTLNLSEITSRKMLNNLITKPPGGHSHKNVVFVFDEFESAIINLSQNQQIKNKVIKSIETKLDNIINDDNIINNDNINTKDYDVIGENTNKKKSKDDVSLFQLSQTNNINDSITLNDILNIIQGSVPLDGLIIVATTNHFDKIKTLCPALFREGRFKPVYFGNPSKTLIDEMSMYYYKKILSNHINIPHKINKPFSYYTELMTTYDFEEVIDIIEFN